MRASCTKRSSSTLIVSSRAKVIGGLSRTVLSCAEVPINIVNGTDSYPKSTTGKTWDNAFDDRLKKNGLGRYGVADRPAVGKDAGAQRIMQNRGNKVGC